MKRLVLPVILLAAGPLSASVIILTSDVAFSVPDDRSTGVFSHINVATIGTVTSATVGLSLGAAGGDQAFLGDLYAYLQHGSGISVLLNRPGRTDVESFGYDDNQTLNVTFADGNPDIHSYRTTLNASEGIPLTSTLTGAWAPDGRTADPSSVLASQSPSALLSTFYGASTQGAWRLFVADLSGGAVHKVDSWTLTLNYSAVPEPGAWAAGSALALLAFAALRRRRN